MNILLIHQSFVSPRESGGTRHYELARHLIKQGHCVTIVASSVSYLTGNMVSEQRGIVTEEKIDDIRLLRAYTPPVLHRGQKWRVASFVIFMVTSVIAAWKAGPVDLVMGTSPPLFQAISGWLISVLRRRPMLLEIRDLWPEFAIDMGILRNPVLIAISRRLERFLYRHATHLLVNSPAYRVYLMDKGIPAENIDLIANGVDPEMFDPQADGQSFRKKWELEGKFVVTYTGAMGIANDLRVLLKAAHRIRHHPAIHILLVGDGIERASLEQQVLDEGLENVTVAGAVPKSSVSEVLAVSDVCVATLQNIPMFKTTYPNKVFDYMAAARPTILAIDGVIRDVIESSEGGTFVPPGNDEKLADAIQYCYENPEDSKRMGQAAREYVVTHFNRHKQAEAFADLVQKISTRRS